VRKIQAWGSSLKSSELMEFIKGQTVRYTRSSGSKCSGVIYKIDGDDLWVRSQCGNVKVHKSKASLK